MTRIITVTGSNTGVGKTHLAVNLSLELVRRGRQVALFHVSGGETPIERCIDIQPLVERRKHENDDRDQHHIISRGYIGIDILSCDVPLSDWAGAAEETVTQCVQAMEVEDGYDDFLVDTSGMGPRELVGCCLAAPLVIPVITPDPHSQAEAFALLRVLRLNGFGGHVRVLVNRASGAMNAVTIHQTFNREVRFHLDIDIGTPLVLPEDPSVARSERYRQAFSAVFPDSEAAAGIVAIADDIENLAVQAPSRALFDYWGRFVEIVRSPIQLPGKVVLEGDAEALGDAGADVAGAG